MVIWACIRSMETAMLSGSLVSASAVDHMGSKSESRTFFLGIRIHAQLHLPNYIVVLDFTPIIISDHNGVHTDMKYV